jgi:16S rRNA processing protein RimM
MENSERKRQGYFAIGQIMGAHGIRGEVKVSVMTDFPERYKPGVKVFVGTEDACIPSQIETSRPHKGVMLVKLAMVPDRSVAETLRGKYLLIPEEQAMPLGEHENYVHDLVGLAVETTDGKALGKLTEILFTRANDVYVVDGPDGEVLLPALREVVVRVDVAAGKMIVVVPDGLLDAEKD